MTYLRSSYIFLEDETSPLRDLVMLRRADELHLNLLRSMPDDICGTQCALNKLRILYELFSFFNSKNRVFPFESLSSAEESR